MIWWATFKVCFTCATHSVTHVWHMCHTCVKHMLSHDIHTCSTPMLHMCSFGEGSLHTFINQKTKRQNSNLTVSAFEYHRLCPMRTAKKWRDTYFGHFRDRKEKFNTVELSNMCHFPSLHVYGPKTSRLKTIFSQKVYNTLTGASVFQKTVRLRMS